MPTFDPILRRLVARVVYDGPALSGKTTNVKRVCEAFPVQKRSELYTPGALKGRTMFFDWLEVEVGKIGQLPVSCQILSVPGQRARSYRRRPLIQSADTIVFVADTTPNQLGETRRCYSLMRRYLRERQRTVPYVVQANKQDTQGALSTTEVAKLLRLGADIPVVPAVASIGDGVRETLNAAVRAAVRYAQRVAAEQGLGAITGTPENADGLLDVMLALEDQIDDMPPEEDPTDEELEGLPV